MAVSAPVIAAITILGCCLVVTSALLVYKLRPDIPNHPGKWSEHSSEPPSPVRKMTVVRGNVVEDDVAKPTRSLLPRWSTLYASRRASVLSSLRGGDSLNLGSDVDLEAQLNNDLDKLPHVNIEEYLGFEKSRRSRRFGGARRSSVRIPKPLTIHRDSFSSDELRISPDALSPKSLPVTTTAAPSGDDSTKISRKSLPGTNDGEPVRHHSAPSNMQILAPQTRGPFHISFLQAASISALPPTAFSARATPEPSVRYSMPATNEPAEGQNNIEFSLISEMENTKKDEEEPPSSRRQTRDLETINEASTGGEAAAPPPVVPLQRSETKPRPRSQSIPRKLREGSLLQRLGRNRPPPIRLSAVNMKNSPAVGKRQSTQRGTWSTPDSETDDPLLTSSVPITPPIMSSNIVSIVPSYPAFVPPSVKDRQSTVTIGSSQYSPTFSLASAHQVPLFAGKLKSLGAHSIRPDVPPLPPLPDMTQSVPTTPRRVATGLRKTLAASAAMEASSFPKPPSSFRSSPLSATFTSQPSPVSKKVHIVSPLVNGNHVPTPDANGTRPSSSVPPKEKPRRPSRYSHLIDKDLPPPPPTASTTVEALLEAQESQPSDPIPKPSQESQPQPPTPSNQQSLPAPQPRRPSSSSTTTSKQTLPALPSSSAQQAKPAQDPKPLIPHTRSQSLSAKAATAGPDSAPSILSAAYYIRDDTQAPIPAPPSTPPALLPTSRAVSPLTTTPVNALTRANSATANSHAETNLRRGRIQTATVSPLSEQFPAELKLNLNVAVGSELGLDFGPDKYGN